MNLLYRRNIMYPNQGWLYQPTKQAIVGAFGADGWAVIKATNDYLNQLAASDRDKATALAALINEDPMMVCSLGLEVEGVTMPIRILIGDGASCIDLGKKFKYYEAGGEILFDNLKTLLNKNAVPFGTGVDQIYSRLLLINNQFCMTVGTPIGDSQMGAVTTGTWYNIRFIVGRSEQSFYIGTTKKYSQNKSVQDPNVNPYFFAGNMKEADTPRWTLMRAKYWYMKEDGMEVMRLVPFVSQTRDGMVDLVAGVFHPNQGTGHFTDAYTLPDGTTWTPSTP